MCHAERTVPVSGGDGAREERIDIQGEGALLPSFFCRPEGQTAPAVLIIHDVYGANDFYHDVARRLAGEGFAALLPDLFVRQGPLAEQTMDAARARAMHLDEPTAMKDIARVIRWLEQHEESTGKVGVVGFCMGGTLALLAACRAPVPAAAVAYYGFPAGRQGWPDRPLSEVENVRSPVLAFWGDQDKGVGVENMEAYESATRNAGKDVETVIYPGLPHGFLTFDPVSSNFEGAQDSWTRMLEFFRSKLAS